MSLQHGSIACHAKLTISQISLKRAKELLRSKPQVYESLKPALVEDGSEPRGAHRARDARSFKASTFKLQPVGTPVAVRLVL